MFFEKNNFKIDNIMGDFMNKIRKEIIANNEISELKTYSLNGYEQKVLIEGRKRDLPITLFLHSGPGSPIPFCAGCRGLFPEITSRTTMVYWDQLGCGINDYLNCNKKSDSLQIVHKSRKQVI